MIQVRNHRNEPISAAACRYDVNANGEINNGDRIVVRNNRRP